METTKKKGRKIEARFQENVRKVWRSRKSGCMLIEGLLFEDYAVGSDFVLTLHSCSSTLSCTAVTSVLTLYHTHKKREKEKEEKEKNVNGEKNAFLEQMCHAITLSTFLGLGVLLCNRNRLDCSNAC